MNIDFYIDDYAKAKKELAQIEREIDSLALYKKAVAKEMEAARSEIAKLAQGGYDNGVASVSVRAVPPKVIVVDESAVPDSWFIPQAPKLDLNGIKSELKKGGQVNGCTLSNGGETISITLKGE